MDEVVELIRSALISTKGKSDLKTLQRDYKMIVGEDIPYKRLGYNSLEQLLRNIPTLELTKQPSGQIFVDAVATANVKHIVGMVSKQKSSKKSKRGTGRAPFRHQQHLHQQNWKPAASGKRWGPALQGSPRPAAVSHRQTVIRAAPSSNNTHVHTNNNTHKPSSNNTNISNNHNNTGSSKASSSTSVSNRLINKPSTQSTSKVQQQQQQQARTSTAAAAAMAELKYTVRNAPVPVRYSPSAAVQQKQQLVMLQPPFPTSDRPRMRSHQAYQPPHLRPTPPPCNVEAWSSPQRATLPSSDSSTGTAEPVEELAAVAAASPAATSGTTAAAVRRVSVEETSLADYNVRELTALLEFTTARHLPPPTVKIVPRPGKRPTSRCLYDCSIKLEERAYQSYPRDCRTREEAVAAAAEQALADLQARHARQCTLLLSTERDILERIPPIIEQHYHGIWAGQVELDYEDMYREQLPANWLALLDTLPNISVEPTVDNKCVLKHCAVNEKHKSMNGSGGGSGTALTSGLASDISVPSNTTRLTDTGFTVEVTYAASTIEIWCRQLETEDAHRYDLLMDRMTEYYTAQPGEHAVSVNVGGFYVVRYEDGAWYRVRALQLGKHDVTFFLIDYGDELVVPRCDIYVLKREFAREPAQAFVCQLVGLEELANLQCAGGHLEAITGRTYVARAVQDSGGDAIPIVLYDLEDGEMDNINRQLMHQIVTASVVTSLDTARINNVYCTHVEANGDVYVQVQSEGYDKLMALIDSYQQVDFREEEEVRVHQVTEEDVTRGTLYLKRWNRDGRYYRCVVNDLSPGAEYAQVYFVDYGGTEIIRLKSGGGSAGGGTGGGCELYLLDRISDVLCAFPHQAFRIRMELEAAYIGADFADRAQQLMPPDRPVLLKVLREVEVDGGGGRLPVCEMFRRSETDSGGLFSVNASLMWGGGSGDGNNNTTPPTTPVSSAGVAGAAAAGGDAEDQMHRLTRKLNRLKSISAALGTDEQNKPVPSTGELPAPDLPTAPNSFLDVRIPFAVSPWNFFIQPYRSASALGRLMERLQVAASSASAQGAVVRMEDVVPGRIYAARHDDGVWYRTSVLKVTKGGISVFYCDVGHYANVTVQQLVHLAAEYKQLPYQAVKARLAGVRPVNEKWTMQDCRYFERLVSGRTFVSVVVGRHPDELYKCDVVLELRLYDTSTNRDVEIDKLLIEEGIATATTVTETEA